MLGNILPPFQSLQELNLDWILTKIKNMLRFLPDDGAVGQILRRTAHGAEWSDESASDVESVNGQTGVVVLDKNDIGLGNVDNVQQYSASNPPPYPVTSVNTQTGDVVLSIPTDTSDLTNGAGFVDAAGAAAAAPVQSVNGQTGTVSITVPTNYAGSPSTAGPATISNALHWGAVDSTSTATVFTATVPSLAGVTAYYEGMTVILRNGVVASTTNCTLNVNGLGALPIYPSTSSTRVSSAWAKAYTMIFVYTEHKISGVPCWEMQYGMAYSNSIGYQLRTNSQSMAVDSATYRYRILFTSADGKKYVPANNSTSTSANTSKTPVSTKIDPWGAIYYYGSTTVLAAGSRPGASVLWQQYVVTLGYSFNTTNSALTLTTWKPVYIVCTPQTDGSAVIDSTTPYVQALPTTEDGKIYIFLGIAVSATTVEMTVCHPVYYYKDSAIRLWTNAPTSGGGSSFQFDLVWDNPAFLSSFAPQTLSVDLTGYDFWAVECAYNDSTDRRTGLEWWPVTTGSKTGVEYQVMGMRLNNNYNASRSFRHDTVNGSEIVVSAGNYNGATANNYIIPMLIYGIKI